MNDAPVYKFGAFFELNNHALMFKTVLIYLRTVAMKLRHGWMISIRKLYRQAGFEPGNRADIL